jgi:two-component system chemotaxis response regulator CheB
MIVAVHRRKCLKAVAVATSAGGLHALVELLSELPADFPAPLIIFQHLPHLDSYQSVLPEILERHCKLPVKWIAHGESISSGAVYVCPQDVQTTVTAAFMFELTTIARVLRPAADPLFVSVAERFGEDAIGIVLTGSLSDGVVGASKIANAGGRVLAQDEQTALAFGMPRSAIQRGIVDFVLSPTAIAHALIALLMAPGADAWFRVNRDSRLVYSGVW